MASSRISSVPAFTIPLVLLAPSVAVTQEVGHRQAFWLNGGLGSGFNEELEWGGSGYVRLGTTLGSHFLLGGQAMQFREDVQSIRQNPDDPTDPDIVEATLTNTSIGAAIAAYPSSTGSFFFKAGVGYGRQEVSTDAGDITVSASRDMLGASLGIGHDFRLGDGNLYLIPNVDAMLQVPDLEIGNTDANFLVTIGLGFY